MIRLLGLTVVPPTTEYEIILWISGVKSSNLIIHLNENDKTRRESY